MLSANELKHILPMLLLVNILLLLVMMGSILKQLL
jgi:hypothetical protein